jgi:hypothetical protein
MKYPRQRKGESNVDWSGMPAIIKTVDGRVYKWLVKDRKEFVLREIKTDE